MCTCSSSIILLLNTLATIPFGQTWLYPLQCPLASHWYIMSPFRHFSPHTFPSQPFTAHRLKNAGTQLSVLLSQMPGPKPRQWGQCPQGHNVPQGLPTHVHSGSPRNQVFTNQIILVDAILLYNSYITPLREIWSLTGGIWLINDRFSIDVYLEDNVWNRGSIWLKEETAR